MPCAPSLTCWALIRARTLPTPGHCLPGPSKRPGGLKIQTIHSFCSSLLRRFPLEAGVSPNFSEMEDRAAELLRAEIVEQMAEGPEGDVIDGIVRYLSDGLNKLTAALVSRREAFDRPMTRDDIFAVFGLPKGLTEDALLGQTFDPDDLDMLTALARALEGSGPNDRKAAAKLRDIQALDMHALTVLEGVLLTGAKAKSPFTAKIGSFPTKAAQKDGAVAPWMSSLDALMERVQEARPMRLGLAAAHQTHALHQFAASFLPAYSAQKPAAGLAGF